MDFEAFLPLLSCCTNFHLKALDPDCDLFVESNKSVTI
jgi:hypothetical protein